MLSRATLILALLLGVGCVRPKDPFPPQYKAIDASEALFPIQYTTTDIPGERRIELSFTNNLEQAVCLYPHFWPYATGGMVDQSPWAPVLVIGQERFPIERVDTGYCPGCALFVAPGETVRASIPYEAFHFPEALTNAEKRLEFIPKAFRCEKRK